MYRDRNIVLKVTEAERNQIKSRAKTLGISMASYIRTALSTAPITKKATKEPRKGA